MKLSHCAVFWMFVYLLEYVNGKSNKYYTIPSSRACGLVREIDGAVVQSATTSASQYYRNSACVIKFMSSDNVFTTKKIRLQIRSLRLSCTSTLKIFYSSGTAGIPAHTFTCKDNITKLPVYVSSGKYVSLRLENNGGFDSSFKLVLATIRTSYCDEFRCSNGYCIDKDLRCDGIDHCFDGSDESSSKAYCYSNRRYYSFNTGSLVGVVISAIVLITIISVFMFICRRRQRMMMSRQRGAPVSVAYQSPAPPPGAYPSQVPAQPAPGYAPVTNSYGDPNAPAGYPAQYPPPTGYPPQPMPGYPPNPEGYNYAPPPAYYQATAGQPPYPSQEQK